MTHTELGSSHLSVCHNTALHIIIDGKARHSSSSSGIVGTDAELRFNT